MKIRHHFPRKLVIFIITTLSAVAINAALFWLCSKSKTSPDDLVKTPYDSTGYTQCQDDPAQPLYSGGLVVNPTFDQDLAGWSPFAGGAVEIRSQGKNKFLVATNRTATYQGPSQTLDNLKQGTKYTLSAWLQISGGSSAFVKATIKTGGQTYICGGSVVARSGCWSFMKGGFVPAQNSNSSTLYFEADSKVDIWIDSVALQPFTDEEWQTQQNAQVNSTRKRGIDVNVIDSNGRCISNVQLKIDQTKTSFPFGSAIAATILDNQAYQTWFVKRFNTAVFENELKWYFTEPQKGGVSYATAQKMLDFCKANSISVRGHNVFWDNPNFVQSWIKSLPVRDLQNTVNSRVQSLMDHFRGQFIGWDVNNEMLHFSFYEDRLGKNASIDFFKKVQELDPETPLYMNEYNVIETCYDSQSTVNLYIEKLAEIHAAGIILEGIGLESHFSDTVPNVAYMRSVLDQFGVLGLPIWLTEVDISNKVDNKNQAIYLQTVLKEGFAHPAVTGIMLWSAWHPSGCYQMCLTDNNFNNLATGDAVDAFLSEHQTTGVEGLTDEHGNFHFEGFLGDYKILMTYNTSYNSSATVASSFSIKSCTQKVTLQFSGIDCHDNTLQAVQIM
ncbi:hypothetical protein O6H91_19G071200 [Diphasiastrum complanatum]|uniref:Uncharacterized protein n=2 Tax=Diphasiastrum complanatum TaxID=34168 RepID=A0ACC2AWB7_DIPCM|nr:hypothetical protein O6H91_19G068700 [Diphasiastrum complanatum]KAJ7521848.1 hypothetical protein O6H91_19G071200 [Diphasiastrum complanatum]